MMILLKIFAYLYVILPFIVHIVGAWAKRTDNRLITFVIVTIIQTVAGLIANGMVIAVARYTEHFLFYRLFRYYAYMRRMGDLLELAEYDEIQNNKQIEMAINMEESQKHENSQEMVRVSRSRANDIDISYMMEQEMIPQSLRGNSFLHEITNDDTWAHEDINDKQQENDKLNEQENKIKVVEDGERENNDWQMLQAVHRGTSIVSHDSYYKSKNDLKLKMYLHETRNCEIWFENWCRIENISSIYFENRKSYIFAVITGIAAGIGFVVYEWINGHDIFCANLITIYIGLCYFFVAYIRLLLSSMRFSDLQRRHIRLIENQRIFALHQMREQDNFPQKKQLTNEYMKAMAKQIESRSLSPTIAGLSLDKALVKLTITTLIGFLTSAMTYALKNR